MAEKKGFLHNLIVGKDKAEGFARASLPSNRWELFWDVLKGRFWKLVLLNLMLLIGVAIPVLLYIMRMSAVATQGSSLPFSSTLGFGYPIIPNVVAQGVANVSGLNNYFFLMLIPALVLAGIVFSGVFYIMRNLVWEEGVFIANDFWRGLKDNILQFMFIMLLEGIVLFLTNLTLGSVNMMQSMGKGNFFLSISYYLSIVFACLFTIMALYMMTLAVTYKLKLRQLLRNSFILTMGLLPQNVFFLVLCFSPLLLILLIPPLASFGLMVYMFIGLSGAILGWTTFNHYVYDKFINDKVQGAQKNRGIYQKVDMQGQPVVKKVKTSMLVKRRPLKPVNDEEVVLSELPTTFTRADLQRLAEEKEIMAEDAEAWSIEHEDDTEILDSSIIYEDADEDDENTKSADEDLSSTELEPQENMEDEPETEVDVAKVSKKKDKKKLK